MNRQMLCLLGALLLSAPLAVAAQSADPNTPMQVSASQDEATGTGQDSKKEKAGDRFCLRNTGSHIAARRTDPARRCTAYGRSYSQDDLQRTGEIDVADALRKLDPSIY